jgi:hypothetical protein
MSGSTSIQAASGRRSARTTTPPVHGFLIGALVAMGICLICLRGSLRPGQEAGSSLAIAKWRERRRSSR